VARLPSRLRSALRSAACIAALALGGGALAISYTVQVIAVSDQEGAIAIYRDLARDGFPGYVVRTTGAQGDVYRVRVGAFANRAAALRYAESMPDVAGSRPVPALAEAIPQGIMPLAPRLLWQFEWTGEEVRLLPWPAGVAVRVQRGDPLRQAAYHVFQDGAERRFEAWTAVPLRRLPDVPDTDLIGVPMVDLTTPAAPPTVEPPAAPAPIEAPSDEGVDAADATDADDADAATDPAADGASSDDVAPAAAGDFDWDPFLAEPGDAEAELGLALLRDRSLWPPSWETDATEVRLAFRASLETIVARALDLDVTDVQALAYAPGGAPPPALIVLDVSDRSGRDAGNLLGLADPQSGLRPSGAAIVIPEEGAFALPSWPSTRVRPDAAPSGEGVGGEAWQALPDDGFVRLTLPDGATWRAGVGAPIWSDGTFVLAWDGRMLLLYDFVPR
jgi:hypothetical protein